ncbi:MAG TPA: hypothetical protein VJ889_14260 [Pseudomonas sp.]|nr:hypothetical protein [Pseudomonas sp.]
MEDQYSVFINAGAVVLLSSTLLEQEKHDVLNSVLFAQLVANKKFPTSVPAGKWYETYLGVLKDTWLQRAVAWESFALGSESKCTMVDWVEQRLEEPLGHTMAARVECVLNNIAQLPCTHPAIELLREQTFRPKNVDASEATEAVYSNVRLEIIVVQQGPLMNSLLVEFETTAQILTHLFGHIFSCDDVVGNIKLRWFQASLSNALYAPVRDAVVTKLADKAAKNILDISDTQRGEAGDLSSDSNI